MILTTSIHTNLIPPRARLSSRTNLSQGPSNQTRLRCSRRWNLACPTHAPLSWPTTNSITTFRHRTTFRSTSDLGIKGIATQAEGRAGAELSWESAWGTNVAAVIAAFDFCGGTDIDLRTGEFAVGIFRDTFLFFCGAVRSSKEVSTLYLRLRAKVHTRHADSLGRGAVSKACWIRDWLCRRN